MSNPTLGIIGGGQLGSLLAESAKKLILDNETEYQGILYQDPNSTSYEDSHGLDSPMWKLSETPPEDVMNLLRELY